MDTGLMSSSLLGNRYQLQQTLGSGGMAVVYKARDLMLERPVAIKILRQDFSQDPNFREHFRQEARAAANLSHPNIVTVHDFGLDQGKLYIVMEYVPGTDLKTMIKQTGRFSIEEAIPLIVQACAGIGYAHRAGLIHCDVKPHNILVTPDMRIKVTDFGIARALSSVQPGEKHDVVWGSPQYFSPEQAAGLAPSPASDVYSLGVILYEMLTGELPFKANDPSKLAQMHRDAQPLPPRQWNPDIPLALEQIMLKVLSKEPSARYRTAEQFGRILTTFSHQEDLLANTFPSIQPTAATTVVGAPISFQQPVELKLPAPVKAPVVTTVLTDTNPNHIKEKGHTSAIDWITILLGLFATIAVGGLFPFWIYIYLTLTTLSTLP
jgi:eukaryotic-like serine/threonine-protein kinase